jgi:hypothetical protein
VVVHVVWDDEVTRDGNETPGNEPIEPSPGNAHYAGRRASVGEPKSRS